MNDNLLPKFTQLTLKVNIVLDASKIDLFETCPMRYNLRHNLNKTLPIIHKAKALDFGSLIHNGYEVYYQMLATSQPYAQRLEATLMKMRELSSNPEESNANPDEVNLLLSVAEQNLDYWRAEDENCLEVLATEQAFAYILYEDESVRIILTGKIDLLVNFNGHGKGSSSFKNLPIDHKTFSRESMLLRKSNQFINYCNAVGSNYLVINRIGLQKTVANENKFKRLPLSYDPIYIQQWKDNLTKMILNEYLTCVAEDYWPEKPTSCNKFNRICEYYELCDTSGKEAKIFKLNEIYVDGSVWDVTAGLANE